MEARAGFLQPVGGADAPGGRVREIVVEVVPQADLDVDRLQEGAAILADQPEQAPRLVFKLRRIEDQRRVVVAEALAGVVRREGQGVVGGVQRRRVQRQRGPPVELQPVAGGVGGLDPVGEVLVVAFQPAHVGAVDEAAAQRLDVGEERGEGLLPGMDVVLIEDQSRLVRGAELEAVVVVLAVGVPHRGAQRQPIEQEQLARGVHGEVPGRVVFAPRIARDVVAAVMPPGDRDREAPRRAPAPEEHVAREGAVGSGLAPAADLEAVRGARLLGDDRDHAAHRVRAVERGLRAAQHLDALDVRGQQPAEIILAVLRRVRLDAVDQDQRVAALGAADADLRDAARPAGAVDGDAGQRAQRVGDVDGLAALQILGGDDGIGAAIGGRGDGREAAETTISGSSSGSCAAAAAAGPAERRRRRASQAIWMSSRSPR